MTSETYSTWWQNLLLIFTSLLVCLIVLEVVIRLLDPLRTQDGAIDTPWDSDGNSALHVRSENSRLVYELRPNATVFVEKFNRTFRTNAAGFRDREFTRNKRDNAYRIAAVGDSVTFGWDQSLAQTYPKLLEAGFASAGMAHVEVLNFGIGGYNSLQEIELIRDRVLDYQPDLLLLGYVMNDNTVQGADGGLARHFNRSTCRACDFIRLRGRVLHRRFGVSPTQQAFRELGVLSATQNIPVVVVIFPLLETDDENSSRAIHDLVHALSEQHNFKVLDLLEPFRTAGFEHIKRDAIHPNAAGHAVAAEQIRAFLVKYQDRFGLPVTAQSVTKSN